MKWRVTTTILLAIALTAPAFAQDPPAPKPPPKIEGPSLAVPGQEVRLSVTGLTTPPLSEGIGRLQEWSTKVSLLVDAPEGGEATADTDLSLGLGAQSVRFRIFFTPTKGGVYLLVLQDANADVVVVKRITVGPVEPTPNPPNPQPPTPVVGGRRFCMLVREARAVTPAMNVTEISLTGGKGLEYLRSKNHQMLILSDDRDPPSNLPPTALAAYQKAKGLQMPCIVILDQASWAELYVAPVDPNATADQILDLIKKYGG